jgi:hypothetical protein
LIAKTNMPPGSLEIEVTESMLVEGGKPAIEALNQLAKDGVLIAIDDFGTGYSSFSYLKTMPAQVLKLDMSFLVDAREDNDAGKIVAAIINMAHALQKEVVAEGIERVDQLKLLKTLGCERGQGYLFGKGVPAENISRTFRKLTEPEPMPPQLAQAAAARPPAPASAPAVVAPAPVTLPVASAALPLPAVVHEVRTLPEPDAAEFAQVAAQLAAEATPDAPPAAACPGALESAAEPEVLLSADAEQAIAELAGAQVEPLLVQYPAHVSPPPAENDAMEIALDFAADHAVSYAAEFAETLAAHRAAQDEVLPSVEFPAIAPALPGESRAEAESALEAGDADADTWPTIDDLAAVATGLSLDDVGVSSEPASAPLRMQEIPTEAHI